MILAEQGSMRCGTLLSWTVLLAPILVQYASLIPGISLGEILLIISAAIVFLFNGGYRIKLSHAKPFLVLWFFGVTISLFSFLLQQDLNWLAVTRLIRFSFYLFLVVICANHVNKHVLLNVYKKICCCISVYIILQFVVFSIAGILLPFKLLPLPWMDGRVYGIKEAVEWARLFYLRPSGVFVEPAYAAQYLLPGLLFALYGWSLVKPSKISIKTFFIILTALVLTNSATGIATAVIIIMLYLVQVVKKNKNLEDVMRNVILVLLGIVVFFYFLQSDIFNRTVKYVIVNISGGGTTALRVFRGVAVFLELPILFKLIGVGHGNLGPFVLKHNITTSYDSVSRSLVSADFANAVSLSLLYYGIIGFVLYLNLFRVLWIKTKDQFRLLIIVLFIISCVSSAFFDVTMLFYVNLIYLGYRTQPVEKATGQLAVTGNN